MTSVDEDMMSMESSPDRASRIEARGADPEEKLDFSCPGNQLLWSRQGTRPVYEEGSLTRQFVRRAGRDMAPWKSPSDSALPPGLADVDLQTSCIVVEPRRQKASTPARSTQ